MRMLTENVASHGSLIDARTTPTWELIKKHLPHADQRVGSMGVQFLWLFSYPGPDGSLGTANDMPCPPTSTHPSMPASCSTSRRWMCFTASESHNCASSRMRFRGEPSNGEVRSKPACHAGEEPAVLHEIGPGYVARWLGLGKLVHEQC